MAHQRKTICPLDCPDACGIVADLDEQGTITKLGGDPDHPFTAGFLCRKVSTYHERVQSPDRVLRPLRRRGPKGAGEFEEIEWEAAWAELVDRLSAIRTEHGGEAVLPYSYAGNMGLLNRTAGDPFFHRFGASRLLRTICSATAVAAWSAHFGSHPASPPETARDADLIIAWGINIKVTNVHQMPFIQRARRRGAKFVVIDPYRNQTAQVADLHLPVRPAGDSALALALLQCLVRDGGIDTAFIADFTTGFEELRAELDRHSFDELCDRSGLEPDTVEQFAQLLKDHPKTFVRIGIGLTRNTRGAASVRSIASLAAALGLFDGRPGRGALLASSSFRGDASVLSHPQLEARPVRAVNMVQLGHALTELDPPIRGLFVYNSNPLSVAPDANRVRQGLAREDLFTVVHEQFLTPTAHYADLVLPATTSFENADLYTGYGHFSLMRTEPVIPPRGQAISNFQLFQELGRRMGFTDDPFAETGAERLDRYIATMEGVPEATRAHLPPNEVITSTLRSSGGDLTAEGAPRFQFAVELPDGNPRVPQPLPGREFDAPQLRTRFPLQLITPPNPQLLNSTFGERYRGTRGTALIHPRDAQARNIEDGDLVELISPRGSTLRTAECSTRTQPGLVVAEGVYWEGPDTPSAINDLTSQETTDLGGGGTFHEARIEVRKATAPAGERN